MNRLTLLILFLMVSLLVIQSCTDESVVPVERQLNLPPVEFDYSTNAVPNHVANNLSDNTPPFNQLTDAGATLGRVLFYDTRLSKNNSVACASCHHQEKGFADGQTFSTGFEGVKTTRNSMAISNLKFQKSFFWDTSSSELEDQVLAPLKNHIEMGMENMDYLVTKIEASDYYDELFETVYGSKEVTPTRVSNALAQFMRSMVSYESKYDQGVESNFSNFSGLEKMGMNLFLDHSRTACGDCHNPQSNFAATWRDHANIGLDLVYEDEGAGSGQFKIPSLRNIALTGPYMHDGRYNTLEEVIEHYNSGIQNHPSLDWSLRDGGGAKKMNLNDLEKQALIAFLHTLTDDSFTSDEKFSNPFR